MLWAGLQIHSFFADPDPDPDPADFKYMDLDQDPAPLKIDQKIVFCLKNVDPTGI